MAYSVYDDSHFSLPNPMSPEWGSFFTPLDLEVKLEDSCNLPRHGTHPSLFTEESSSSSDEGSTIPYHHTLGFSSPEQFSSPEPFIDSPFQHGLTLTVNPSDLTRSESPSFSESDTTPPPTMHLPVRSPSRSSLFSIDSYTQSDWDDSDKDEDYKPHSDKPVFTSNGKRKRFSSVDSYIPEIVEKKPRISGAAKRPTAKSAIKLPSAKLARAGPMINRTRVAPPSRNIQADSMTAAHIREKLACTKTTNDDWVCPACPWAQHNHRMPDYKRHLKTHLPEAVHWCCGVPLREAERYHISVDAETFMHEGELRVGGCMRSFSRADALTRHIGNPNMPCVAEQKDDQGY